MFQKYRGASLTEGAEARFIDQDAATRDHPPFFPCLNKLSENGFCGVKPGGKHHLLTSLVPPLGK